MRRYFLILLKLAVSITLIVLLYRHTPLEQITSLLAQVKAGYLLPIGVLLFINTVISAKKWQIFLRADNLHISLWDLTVSYMSGTFCNLFLPSNIGGDSYRAAIEVTELERQLQTLFATTARLGALSLVNLLR